jgi:transposase
LDVHKRSVVACLITPEGKQTRTFGTMTKDLLALGEWLLQQGVTHVAMESTGVFWKPVYNILEGMGFQLLVANARHIKAVPGRKTDVKDAEWIADLLRHGLIRGSSIPDRPQRELQELVRYRTSLIRQRAQLVQRIQKVLEGANIKLAAVATDVVGVSGRAMLEAMVAGVEDPEVLAGLARGRLKGKQEALEAALVGKVGPHQRLLLGSLLRLIDALDQEIATLDEEVARRLGPFEEELQRLDTIPGVGRRAGEQLLAELGTDLSRFPTAGHLASWAKVCPSNRESAGKRQSGRTGKGNPWLRGVLVEIAWGAARTRGTYLSALFHRLAARRGTKRALVAVAHTIVRIVYHLLRHGRVYQDLGGNYFDERQREATVRRAVRRIERLGYQVTLQPAS